MELGTAFGKCKSNYSENHLTLNKQTYNYRGVSHSYLALMNGTFPKTTFQSVKYSPTNENAAPHKAAGLALQKVMAIIIHSTLEAARKWIY